MPTPVTDEYAELMHYTSGEGLTGILTSGCVWATHASFLNDSEEIRHFFDTRLIDLVHREASEILSQLSADPEIARKIAADGGFEQVVESQTQIMVSTLRAATLATNQTHIFSLCATKDSWVAQNGLLSQWRGYGTDGGYAIVFDTKGLDHLIQQERDSFHYQWWQWEGVYYYGNTDIEQPATEYMKEAEEKLIAYVNQFMRDPDQDKLDDMYPATTTLSCYYKHRGFFEEREVRVVFIPINEQNALLAAQGGETKPHKPILSFMKAGIPVPYIELFKQSIENKPGSLPIKRVIIGPHRDKELRATAIDKLLKANGYDVPVLITDIPYIGR